MKHRRFRLLLNFNFSLTLISNIRGTYGTVYICNEKTTGLKLAAKFVKCSCKEDRRNMEREISIMSGLHSPRIIQLYDAFDDGTTITCVLELYALNLLRLKYFRISHFVSFRKQH